MKPSSNEKPELWWRREGLSRETKAPSMRRAEPRVVEEDRIREFEEQFRVRQQMEAKMAEGMLGKISEGSNKMDETAYEMLRALKEKYDSRSDISPEERERDLATLMGVRNGLTSVFRNIDLVSEKVTKGVKERRKLEMLKRDMAERKQREAEEASLWGRIKSVFAPKEPTPIAISGKRGRQVELVRVDDESEQYLQRLKKRRDELTDVMEEVENGIKYLRQMDRAA